MYQRKVVVVEDDAQLRFLAGAVLEETGLHVVECETAAEGFDYIKSHPDEISLVLTDIETPGPIDGLELAEQAVALCPDARVLVTSGRVQPDRLPPGVRFLPKPWLPLDLLVEAERRNAPLS